MPNDAKTELDRATHRLQDQPTTANPDRPPHSDGHSDPGDAQATPNVSAPMADERQPPQAQQRDTTGTILPQDGDDQKDDDA